MENKDEKTTTDRESRQAPVLALGLGDEPHVCFDGERAIVPH
jgi:hypothetical protein